MLLHDIDAEDYKLLCIKILSYHIKSNDHYREEEKFTSR